MQELKALTDSLIQEMRRNTEEVTLLRESQADVLKEHVALRRANRRGRRWTRIAVALIVAGGLLFYWAYHSNSRHVAKISGQQTTDLICIALHEDAQDARSTVLSKASDVRSKANRQMVDAQFTALKYSRTPHADLVTLQRLVDRWNAKTEAWRLADDAYTNAAKAHPVPQLQFTCSDRLHSKQTPAPTVTATTTATAGQPGAVTTSTARVTVPGPTATAWLPGPARTVVVREPGSTQVRTVTTTSAPPNCMAHPVPPCTLTIPTLPKVP